MVVNVVAEDGCPAAVVEEDGHQAASEENLYRAVTGALEDGCRTAVMV